MNQVTPFNFDNLQVRVVVGSDGEPWFVAKDVAEALGYSNPRDAISKHCKAVNKDGVAIRDSIGRMQSSPTIPERDVYRLIMRSKLPSAERFEEWVVGEVLPSIRKAGSYVTPATHAAINPTLALLECACAILNPAPSSRVSMLKKAGDSIGADTSFLPDYTEDAPSDAGSGGSWPTKSATALLSENGVGVRAADFNRVLHAKGYLNLQTRRAKSGEKKYWVITAKGERFGKNITSPHSPRETQPHWYVDRFGELLDEVLP